MEYTGGRWAGGKEGNFDRRGDKDWVDGKKREVGVVGRTGHNGNGRST